MPDDVHYFRVAAHQSNQGDARCLEFNRALVVGEYDSNGDLFGIEVIGVPKKLGERKPRSQQPQDALPPTGADNS